MGFRACRVFDEGGKTVARLVDMETDELSAGDVVVRVHWSGVNFKDALAVTGRGKILKRFPAERRHRRVGHRRVVAGCALPPGHARSGERHGPRRGARRRLRREAPAPRGLARAAAGRPHAAQRDGAGHGRLHGGARNPPHGAERPASRHGAHRGDRRHGRRRLDRDLDPRRPRLPRGGRVRPARAPRVPRGAGCGRGRDARGARPRREEAARGRALRRGDRQRGRRRSSPASRATSASGARSPASGWPPLPSWRRPSSR